MKRRRVGALLVVAAMTLGSCGGTSSDTTTNFPTIGSTRITIDNFAFSPATITVQAGTEVTWQNMQGSTHTVTGDADGFDSAQLPKDAEFSQTFDTPGEYDYHCEIHPNMTGKIIVEP